MKRHSVHAILIIPLLAALAHVTSTAAATGAGESIATTHQEVTVDGRRLQYTVRAGRLPIRANETGEIHGQMFFTAYSLDRSPSEAPRPLTFLWNGGPGANSVLVHLEGFGPKRIVMPDSPLDPPTCDCELESNDGTWLEATDLVFVDPIGTGFSRLSRREHAGEFYNVLGDTASVAEFIRLYLTRFDAWDAPLFVGGESYGTWRAAGVADALVQRDIRVAGVILISGGVPVGSVESEEMRVAHLITSRTATAFYHRRLAADLQGSLENALKQAETWARSEYGPALARRDTLSDSEREGVVTGLARFTGLKPDQIDRKTLVINRQDFLEKLLPDSQRVPARFDTRRLVAKSPVPSPAGARAVLVGRYLRGEIGFDTDLAYLGLERGYRPVTETAATGPAAEWRYNQSPADEAPPARLTTGDGPPGARPAWLRSAIERRPSIRAFVATGLYDSLNSCALNSYVVSRLDAAVRDRITTECYEGGHMMYQDRGTRLQLKRDVTAFIHQTVAGLEQTNAPSRSPRPPDRPAQDAGVEAGGIVTTTHAIQLGGKALGYTARAGQLPIRHNETGETRGNIFFVAYSVPADPGRPPRPVMFAWNGGPGSNASLLHVTAMGPRRLTMGDVYPTADPAQMSALVDNEATWLDDADLVFVDPVGTGFSRPTSAEYGAEFYDTVGDIESLAEFIRVYRVRFQALEAPVFLAGESYGSRRAAAVAEVLERNGIHVAGLVLISGDLGIGSLSAPLATALSIPSYTATALYHGKLSRELTRDHERTVRDAMRWARSDYAPALANVDGLGSTERAAILQQLARFTGLPESSLDREKLSIALPAFADRLLEKENRVLGRYDSRLSRPRKASEGQFDPREDASLSPLEGRISGNSPVMNRYLRDVLRYENDLLYVGPFGGAWPPPTTFRGDWMSVRWNRKNPGPTEPLRTAMTMNPALTVLAAFGIYDLVIPPGPRAYVIEQLEPDVRRRITFTEYVGGHSFYLDAATRMQFKRDGAAFVARALAAAGHRVR
jgi:carboxypeptidase C (cathepsin A)